MKVERLRELLTKIEDGTEIFIRNSNNIFGNIQELEQVELSTYGFFGVIEPCLILNTDSSKKIETNEEEDEYIDFIGEFIKKV